MCSGRRRQGRRKTLWTSRGRRQRGSGGLTRSPLGAGDAGVSPRLDRHSRKCAARAAGRNLGRAVSGPCRGRVRAYRGVALPRWGVASPEAGAWLPGGGAERYYEKRGGHRGSEPRARPSPRTFRGGTSAHGTMTQTPTFDKLKVSAGGSWGAGSAPCRVLQGTPRRGPLLVLSQRRGRGPASRLLHQRRGGRGGGL